MRVKEESITSRPTRRADEVGAKIVERKGASYRKENGIFLTPVGMADFMASHVGANGRRVRLLDPGAGSGTLLCALVEHLVTTNPSLREIDLVAYETDADLQDGLSMVLEELRRWSVNRGIDLKAVIERRDFLRAHAGVLADNGALFAEQISEPFDVVIANPPYFKIAKSDQRAKDAAAIVHGQPNIYALFMGVAAALLRPSGEFLFIIPRSFAAGPYFRVFRERFFDVIRPVKVHLFGSRREAFGRDEVLQENLVLYGLRDRDWLTRGNDFDLTISSSAGLVDIDSSLVRTLPMADALSSQSSDRILRLPVLGKEDAALKIVDSWSGSLHQYHMNISTGPVVPFRATEFLCDTQTASHACVPLIWMNHVHAMQVSFPNGTKKPQYIARSAMKRSLLLPNRNYVLLRRFSAKEEAHRLV